LEGYCTLLSDVSGVECFASKFAFRKVAHTIKILLIETSIGNVVIDLFILHHDFDIFIFQRNKTGDCEVGKTKNVLGIALSGVGRRFGGRMVGVI
jgi:hypothetical protein